jgi:broad specificity phosphatase PhoE
MKKILFTAVFLCVTLLAFSQEKITTFILVRHAEKDLTQSTNDPDLSAEGKARAAKLAEVLKQTDVTAIYSTPYKRTQQTVALLATEKSLSVQGYKAKNEDVDAMLTQHAGGTIVVAGHSNTVPQFVNYLLGEEKYKILDDGDYGNLIVVSVTTRGKDAKVTWLKF